ncbi:MAG: preprotein translocase subunit SecG [Clostridia bacterium]|nr:preprotein translocase subunit SecG [Clostridia bacterium]
MLGMLLETTNLPLWVTDSFPIIRIVLFCLVVACAIILIITTLFQHEESNGTDVITGQQESYYSKNKGGSRDGKLRLITIITSIVAVVCVILYFVSLLIYNGN